MPAFSAVIGYKLFVLKEILLEFLQMIVHSFVNGFQAKKTEMLRFIRLNKTPEFRRGEVLNVDNVDKFVYNSTFPVFSPPRCVDKQGGKQFPMVG